MFAVNSLTYEGLLEAYISDNQTGQYSEVNEEEQSN